MQKYIRRGNFEKAVYCAYEIYLLKFATRTPDEAKHSTAIHTNLVHRLQVIFLEDCGLGGIEHWPVLAKAILRIDHSEQTLVDILATLCAIPKSRECSHVRAIFRPDADVPNSVFGRNSKTYRFAHSTDKYREVAEIQDNVLTRLKGSTFEDWCRFFKEDFKNRKFECIFWAAQDCVTADVKVTNGRKTKPVYELFKYLKDQF